MTNELVNTNSFELAFEPARLEFENFDEMKAMVESYAKRYDGLVFEPEDKKGLEQARSELLALYNALETERKNVKRVYSEPLDAFEDKVKEMTGLIQKPLDDVRDGIKAIDDAQREARREALESFIGDMIKDKPVKLEDLEWDDKWLNKGNWNKNYKPKGTLEAELENEIERLVEDAKRREHDVKVLTKYCESVGVDPSGWIEQLDYRSSMEIVDAISREVDNMDDTDDSADAEGESSPNELESNTWHSGGYDEPVEHETNTITNTIQVTGTIPQLNALNDFLVDSGIMVVQVG